MGVWGVVIVVVLIILGIIIYQNGWEGFKAKPVQSSYDSAKSVVNTGKNVVGYFHNGNNSELIEVGKIPCKTNEDCNILIDCQMDLCQCYDDGTCYIEGGG